MKGIRLLGRDFTSEELERIKKVSGMNNTEVRVHAMAILMIMRGVKCAKHELFEFDGCWYTRNGFEVTHYGRDREAALSMWKDDMEALPGAAKPPYGVFIYRGKKCVLKTYRDCEGYEHRKLRVLDGDDMRSISLQGELSGGEHEIEGFRVYEQDGKYYVEDESEGFLRAVEVSREHAVETVLRVMDRCNSDYDDELCFEDMKEGLYHGQQYRIYDVDVFRGLIEQGASLKEAARECKEV